MRERRYTETRVTEDRGKIWGTASVTYNGQPGTEYQLWEGAVERIAEGAFDEALSQGQDVVALFNHDPNIVLGRTPDTLKLRASKQGLHYEVDPPDTQAARDLLTSIRRGDIRGSSFAFQAKEVEWRSEGETDIRVVQKANLFDVSPVTYPAYAATSTGVRADERKRLEDERDEYRNRVETEKRLARLDTLRNQQRSK